MKNGRKLWILAYVVGVGLFSSGITIACSFLSVGDFRQRPSSFYGSSWDSECMEQQFAPFCGYYLCMGGACPGHSMVQGCTWAGTSEMYLHMLFGCSNTGCGGY